MNGLTTQALSVSIAGRNVCRELQLQIQAGQFWALLGPNGIGKTTLLRHLAGLLDPSAGQVLIDGVDITQIPRRLLARQLGMLQQHTVYLFDCSVLQTALTGRHPWLSYWQREGSDDHQMAHQALASVDLQGFSDRSVVGLSGGEARRLALASLLVQDTAIMLLDEPSNHLDLRHQTQVMRLIAGRVADGTAALAALHDVNLAARYCSHVIMLFGDGEWGAGTANDMLNETQLERLYQCPIESVSTESGLQFYPAESSGGFSDSRMRL